MTTSNNMETSMPEREPDKEMTGTAIQDVDLEADSSGSNTTCSSTTSSSSSAEPIVRVQEAGSAMVTTSSTAPRPHLGPEVVAVLQLTQRLEQQDRARKNTEQDPQQGSTNCEQQQVEDESNLEATSTSSFADEVDVDEVNIDRKEVNADNEIDVDAADVAAISTTRRTRATLSPDRVSSSRAPSTGQARAPTMSPEDRELALTTWQLEQRDQLEKHGSNHAPPSPPAADLEERNNSEWKGKRDLLSLTPANNLLGSGSQHENSDSSSFTKAGLSNHSHSQLEWERKRELIPSNNCSESFSADSPNACLHSDCSIPPLSDLQQPGKEEENEETGDGTSVGSFAQEGLFMSSRSRRKELGRSHDSSTSVVPRGAFSLNWDGTLNRDHPGTRQFLTGNMPPNCREREDDVQQDQPPEQARTSVTHGSSIEVPEATLVDPLHESDPIISGIAEPLAKKRYPRRCIAGWGLLGVVLLVLALVVFFYIRNTQGDGQFQVLSSEPILQRVAKRGVLKCGVNKLIRDMAKNFGTKVGIEDFLDISMCRAVAAAVFDGNGDRFDIVMTDFNDPYKKLADGDIDMLVSFNTMNTLDDIRERSTGLGFTHSIPIIYLEQVFGGNRTYINCAERFDNSGECSDMKICFVNGTEKFTLYPMFGKSSIVLVENITDLIVAYLSRNCQVVSVLKGEFQSILRGMMGGYGEFELGNVTNNLGAEGLAVLTVDGDPEWSAFINAIIMAILTAAKNNITQATAEQMGQTDLFGDAYKNMFIHVISLIGSYYDMYEREINRLFPLTSINRLNDGSTGLIQAYKFLDAVGPAPNPQSTMGRVWNDRTVRCAIRPNRPGFAWWNETSQEWSGIDVKYCRVVGAGLFGARSGMVEFVQVANQTDGYAHLASNKVDIFAGATLNLRDSVKFSYSQPYFYAPIGITNTTNSTTAPLISIKYDENLCVATRKDAPVLSAFVFWGVGFTFEAEHMVIHNVNEDIEEVNLFGSNFKRMFREIYLAVGHYGQIYAESLPFLPRNGRNNPVPPNESTPRHYVWPWTYE